MLKSHNLLTLRAIVKLGRPMEALGLPTAIVEKIKPLIDQLTPHATASTGYDKGFPVLFLMQQGATASP